MKSFTGVLLAILAVLPLMTPEAAETKDARIGYVYPAGGERGTTFEVSVGGQYLRNVREAHVSGRGVQAAMIENIKPLNRRQLGELRQRLNEIRQKKTGRKAEKKPDSANAIRIELPDHPMLRNIENLSPEDLKKIQEFFFNPKKQPNQQIAETVRLRITIAPDAAPGDREIRLISPGKVSNPLCFQVGSLKEINETEPNNLEAPDSPAVELPVLFNGQIMPGDVDRFRFRARKGDKILMNTHARKLVPFLADAVPGWFQAVTALYDEKGRELAYADDYYNDPDPMLLYEIPVDGFYQFEIRDSVYRGREDFVYRVSMEKPSAGMSAVSTKSGAAALEFNEKEPNDQWDKASLMELPQTVHGVILTPEDTDKFKFMGKEGEEIVIEVKARRINSPLDALVRLTDSSGKVLEWNDDFPARNTGLLTHHADSRMQTKLPGDGQYGVQISDTQGHGGEAYVYSLYIGPKRPGFELYMTPSGAGITAGGRVPITVHAIRRDGFNGEIQLSLEGDSRGFKLEGGVIPGGRDSIRLTLSAPMNMTGDLCDLRMTGMARIAGKIVEEPVIPAEDMMQAFAYMHLVPSREFLVAFAKNRRMGALIGPAEGVPIRIPEGGRTPVRMKIPLRARMGEISLELADPPKGIHVRDVALEPGYLAFVLCADAEEGPGAGYADNLIVEAFMKQEAPRPGAGNAGKGKKIEGAKNRNAGKEKTERGDRANRKNSEQNDKSGDVPAEKKKSEPDVPETVQTAAVQKRPVSLGVLPAIPFEIVRP